MAFALSHFDIDPTDRVCADLGCNVGGFVDCLLKRGARKVYAIDTGYGALDWSLRRDPRVVVMERTNALDVELPEKVDLVSIDVAWTPQHLILPRALALLETGAPIVTLIKPQYEAGPTKLHRGRLPDERVDEEVRRCLERLFGLGIHVSRTVESPLRGDGGNREVLALVCPQGGESATAKR